MFCYPPYFYGHPSHRPMFRTHLNYLILYVHSSLGNYKRFQLVTNVSLGNNNVQETLAKLKRKTHSSLLPSHPLLPQIIKHAHTHPLTRIFTIRCRFIFYQMQMCTLLTDTEQLQHGRIQARSSISILLSTFSLWPTLLFDNICNYTIVF